MYAVKSLLFALRALLRNILGDVVRINNLDRQGYQHAIPGPFRDVLVR